MKLKNYNIVQKIAIVLVCLVVFNFITPTYVSNASLGGVLFSPIKELLVTMGDIVLDLIDMGFTGKFENVMKEMLAYRKAGDENNRFTGDDDEREILMSKVSLESIFSNNVEFLNVDFINPINEDDYTVKNKSTTEGLTSLRKIIAAWYVAIRNFSLVIMLSILVYVGIRIIISSAASDKAKYKQLLLDWIVGMCLLFMLHYVMSISIMITEKITEMLSDATSSGIDLQKEDIDGPTELIGDEFIIGTGDNKITYKKGDNVKKLQNISQYVRYYADLRQDLAEQFTYLIIYLFLVAYIVIFAIRYMKRMVIMAFLTMIAPFVAMTYPIDKMTDGKAQAFNFWFKEYIFNLLIQPFHLILYTILVGTSAELATSSLIYALVAIASLLPAEKLLKQMFGFDKAHTPPGIAAPAMATALANQLTGKARGAIAGSKHSNNSNINTKNEGKSTAQQKTRTADYNFDSFNSTDAQNEGGDIYKPSGGINENDSNASNLAYGKNYNNDELEQMEEGLKLEKGTLNSPYSPNELDDINDYYAMQYAANEYNNRDTIPNNEDTRSMLDNNPSTEFANSLNSALNKGKNDENKDENKNANNVTNQKLSEQGKSGNKLKRGLKNAGKIGAYGVKKIARPKNIPKGIKFVAKAGLGVAGALGGGAAGLALGALTGKPSMAFSAMAAGAGVGGKMGTKTVDKAVSAGGKVVRAGRNAIDSASNFKNEALYGEREAYERRKEKLMANERKSYAKNTQNRDYFQQKTGAEGDELDKIMNSAAQFNQMGVKDNDEILKALELEQIYKEDYNMNDQQAHQLAGISAKMVSEEGYSISDFSDDKKRAAVQNRTEQIVKDFGGNLNENQQANLTQQIMSGNEYMSGYQKRQDDRMNYRDKPKNTDKHTAEVINTDANRNTSANRAIDTSSSRNASANRTTNTTTSANTSRATNTTTTANTSANRAIDTSSSRNASANRATNTSSSRTTSAGSSRNASTNRATSASSSRNASTNRSTRTNSNRNANKPMDNNANRK